jgi:glutathione S-transferase
VKLYMFAASHNSRRARITARLVGLPVEEVALDLGKAEHRSPAFLAINPNHKAPALVDGDFKLWESAAICQYLANKAGRVDLWPTEARAQADVSRWILWNHTQLSGPVSTLYWEKLLKGMMGLGSANDTAVSKALEDLASQLAVLEARLEGRTHLCGGGLTLADVVVGATFTYADAAGLPLSDYPNVLGWRGRLEALPAFAETAPRRG